MTEWAPRGPNKNRDKSWWIDGYNNWDNIEFKRRLRLERSTFEMILNIIKPSIYKAPTNWNPEPLAEHHQLALTFTG